MMTNVVVDNLSFSYQKEEVLAQINLGWGELDCSGYGGKTALEKRR